MAKDYEVLYINFLEHVEQEVGKTLGFPWYKDDQKNFPGATEEHGVCVGALNAIDLIDILIYKYNELKYRIESLEK